MVHLPQSKEQLSLFKATLSLFKGHLYTLMMLKMSLPQRPNSKNCSKLLKPVPQSSQPSQLSQLHQWPQLHPPSFHTEDTTVTTSEDTTVLDIMVMLDTHTVHMLVITVHMLVMLVIHSVTFPTNS